jgi:hypothetical protein
MKKHAEKEILVADTGKEFSVRLTGKAYRQMKEFCLQDAALASDKERMAAVTLLGLATVLMRKLTPGMDVLE